MTTPTHYKQKVQPIDLIEAFDLNFNLGNVVKYVSRAGRKGDALEDLEKAFYYLKREMQKYEIS
jgi:hypothetical protein